MTTKPQKFKHISRCVDTHGVHHLDALDEHGRHWYEEGCRGYMTKILLLEGLDGNRYKGTLIGRDIWYVENFANMRSSIWWRNEQQFGHYHFTINVSYTDENLKETFVILAESETCYIPDPIHDAFC